MAEDGRALTDECLGRWRVERVLGEGATARVFEARHVDMGRRAAVKVLHTERSHDPVARARFVREADAVARVRHPNVVPILDAGIDRGLAYVVMDLVEGVTLRSILAREKRLEPLRAARIGRDLAAGLAAVHECGVVHRDVKPENVVILRDGREDHPVLVDFGAAWLADPASGDKLTLHGELIGTPRYMSPEQGAGASPDARADVYSLGVVLYECLTGCCPYDGPTWQATLLAAARGRCPTARAVRSEVPVALERVVRRAMEPDRVARFPSAAALRDALDVSLRVTKRSVWPVVTAASIAVLGGVTLAERSRAQSAPPAAWATIPTPALPRPSAAIVPPASLPAQVAVTEPPPTSRPPAQPSISTPATRPRRRGRSLLHRIDASTSTPAIDAGEAPSRVLGRGAHGAWILAPPTEEADPP